MQRFVRRKVRTASLVTHEAATQMLSTHVSWLIVIAVSCLASHAQAEEVECTFEHLIEDYMEDPSDTYDNEYGVCTTVAGSGRTKTFYLTEPGMPHMDRT